MRMAAQKFSYRFSQGASTVAMNYAHFTEAVQEGFVEKLVREIDGFVGCLADEIEFICLESGIL